MMVCDSKLITVQLNRVYRGRPLAFLVNSCGKHQGGQAGLTVTSLTTQMFLFGQNDSYAFNGTRSWQTCVANSVSLLTYFVYAILMASHLMGQWDTSIQVSVSGGRNGLLPHHGSGQTRSSVAYGTGDLQSLQCQRGVHHAMLCRHCNWLECFNGSSVWECTSGFLAIIHIL